MLIPYCSFSIVTVTPITTGQPFLHIFNITILPIMSDISASKAYRSEYDKHGKGTFGAINKSRAACQATHAGNQSIAPNNHRQMAIIRK